jgi:iron complex outermembrane receptor protein
MGKKLHFIRGFFGTRGKRNGDPGVRQPLAATAAAIAVGLLAMQAPPVSAQTTQAASDKDALEEVIVTGSILRRTDTETPSPVTVITAESLQERGINTIAEATQRLVANNAGTINSNWSSYGFSTGAVAPSLRGLTVQDTLSVFDGVRMAPYPLADDGQRNFVDVSTIPDAIVDRIEVLRDGASSTYGADAIAGVVNIITKKEIKGWHIGASDGFAQQGGALQRTLDVTYGIGDLASQGYNFYVSAEYKKDGALWARDRGYPFNTGDFTHICGPSGSCMYNTNWNGVTPEAAALGASFNGLVSIPGVTLVRPVTTAGGRTGSGRYSYLDAGAGCRNWKTVTLGPDQLAESGSTPTDVCEVDFNNAYNELQPEVQHTLLSMRFTGNVTDRAQLYAMVNYADTQTLSSITPLGFNGTPTPPRPATLLAYNVILPVYTCSQGVGTPNGVGTGCDATNGVLNPYNPYAAAGQTAQVSLRSPYARTTSTDNRSLRASMGLEGSFGSDWRYSANLTLSEVDLRYVQTNYLIPQRIMDVVARGTFNFADPYANSQEIWNYIAPPSDRIDVSRLGQLQGTLSKTLATLAGGPLQAAVGASYRQESITTPSANPANDSAPYTRYYSINAVGTAGSRDVKSGFFELDAPVVKQLELIASGRYDKYSTGQSNFSPKVGFKFKPVQQLALRGTYAKGFRIPSFNEAFGLPTTGYVTRVVDCGTYATFCAAHGNNNYVTQSYSLGLTQTGNPSLKPEKSTSFTGGVVFEPRSNVSLTVDYWNIKVDRLITGVTDTSAAEAAYYANNGVVNLPGINVLQGAPDPSFPNALPVIGFIESSYLNQDSQTVSGVDFGANVNFSLGKAKLRSGIDLSYLMKYELTTDQGVVNRYDGTLSPCNITSCSGAPKWRGSWQNSLQYGDTTVSLTAYYTSGYDTASIDFGGVKGDCAGNAASAASTVAYVDGSPVLCSAKAVWNVDLTARQKVSDKLTVYLDVLNAFNIAAPFEPSAAYNLYQYNPAWASPNIIGRYFRLGVKADF